MADDTSPASLLGFKPQKVAPGPPPIPAPVESSPASLLGFKSNGQRPVPSGPPQPEDVGPPPIKSGSFLTRPISETLFGKSSAQGYDWMVKNLLPESMQKEKGAAWGTRFTEELVRGGPEVLDFAQSPMGGALIAAHMFPATAPFAGIVDVGMGLTGAWESVPQVIKALSDGTPESWAQAVKGIAMSYMMVKGGTHTFIGSTFKFRAEPLEQREMLREEITHAPPSKAEIARIAEKVKGSDVKEVERIARQPLSEIEKSHKQAVYEYETLKDKLTKKALAEKRPLTFPEKQALRDLGKPVRLLGEIRGSVLPEKITAVEKARALTNPNWAQKMYGSAWLKEPAKMFNIPMPRLMQVSADIVFDRSAFLASRNLQINRLLYDWKSAIPLEDRGIRKMGYVLQGSATPEQVGLSPQARAAIPGIRDWVANQDAMIREAYGDRLPLQEAQTYLSQIWDFTGADEGTKQHAARTLMNDPFLKKKKIDSYQKGIEELHLKPKYNDVMDLLKIRADFASKAIANRRMAGWLRDMGVIISEPEYRALRPDRKLAHEGEQPLNAAGVPYGTALAQSMSNWKPATEAVSLYKAAYSDKPMDPGMMLKAVYVHPDFADSVNAVFGKGFDNTVFNGLEHMRASGKQFALTGSMFHHWALTEQAHAIYATRNPAKGIFKTAPLNRNLLRGLKSGLWEAFGREGEKPPVMKADPKLTTDAVEHGLSLKSEDQESIIQNTIAKMADSHNRIARTIGVASKPIAKVLRGWDRALWDFYHQGLMLDSYEMIVADELKKLGPAASEAKVRETKRAVAEHVNNAYGSVSYEKMLLSPKIRQSLNWILLAPAWTLSNIRVLTSGYETEAGVRLTNQYVKGAAISWFLSTQAMNYALSWWNTRNDPDGPKPRFTYDNPGLPITVGGRTLKGVTDNSLNVYAGKNDDGSEKYIQLGKGFRDVFRWLSDPVDTFWGKTSLPFRQAFVQSTGHDPGTGFEEIDLRASDADRWAQRAAAGVEALGVPFTAERVVREGMHAAFPEAVPKPQVSTQFLSLPARKGTTFTRVEQVYRDAINDGDELKAQDALATAAANGIDPRKIKATYKTDERKRQRRANQ